jgi:hypothetical protein
MANRHRKLRMEQMEAREMMAGDVTASVVNGNLILNEAAGHVGESNQVLISQMGRDKVRVTGLGSRSIGSTSSLINGKAWQDFTVPGNLTVNFGGGNDLVNFDASAPPHFQDVTLNMAAVSSQVPITKGNDSVMIWNAVIRGSLTVNTGVGDDWVYIENASIGGGATINTGAGSDEVDLMGAHISHNLDIQTYGALTENDADVVNFDSNSDSTQPAIVDGNVNVRMGGGDDGFYVTNPNFADANVDWLGLQTNGSMTVDTGAGNDTAYLRNLRIAGNFSINTGAGADTLDMRQTRIAGETGIPAAVSGNLSVQMFASTAEADADSATFETTGSTGSMTVLMGGGNDVLKLTNVFTGHDLNLDAGAGDDNVQLTEVTAIDNFFANLGDGNDVLTVNDLSIVYGKGTIDGGAGTDSMTKTGYFPTGQVTQANFEWINGQLQSILPIYYGNLGLAR